MKKILNFIRFFNTIEYRSLKKDYSNPQNINHELCKDCGGRCCKRCGCHYSPDDFEEISFEYLKSQILKGNISIDYADKKVLQSKNGLYFLRVRNIDSPIVDTDYKNRRPCKLLTETGCMLSYDARPSGGKLLMPRTVYDASYEREFLICTSSYPIDKCCYEWKPHQKVLRKLVRFFRKNNF